MILIFGCDSNMFPERREINDFEMVQLIAIDKCSRTGLVEVTVIDKITKEKSNGGSGSEIVNITSGIGRTAFEAVRNLKAHSDKAVFFSHAEYFIFGETAASEDFGKYFDIISRDPELRLTPKVYIAKGCMAKDLVFDTASQDKYIVDRLRNMGYDQRVLGRMSEVSIIDVIRMLNTPDEATVIPALERHEIQDEMTTGNMPRYDIITAGYAVIKNFKLAGYINESLSRGYNFLVNKLQSTPMSMTDFSGEYVGLEVVDSKTRVKANFKGDRLIGVIFVTHVISNVEEQHSRENIISKKGIADLGIKQSEIILNEMEEVIKLSKKLEIDCIDLRKRIRLHHPVKWEKIKNEWDKIYPELDIKVIVTSEVARTYEINQPNGYEMRQSK